MPAWATGDAGAHAPGAQSGPSAEDGLLSYFTSGLSGYVPLRSSERSSEEEAFLSLSHWERLLGFIACIVGSALCFIFSFIFLAPPILALRPHKFALAFSLASVLFLLGCVAADSFAVLVGPMAQLRHLFARERAPFSAAYICALLGTIYCAVVLRWRFVTLVLAVVQIVALLAYLAAYFPGGTTTLRYVGSLASRGGRSLLPL